jgi:hypothetical protein
MIEILIKLVSGLFVMVFAFAIGFGLWRVVEIPLRKWRESTFDYVYVEEDGNVRELTASEEEFVSAEVFAGGDADRLIKSDYKALTADGRLAGYIQRRRLPRAVRVHPAERWD